MRGRPRLPMNIGPYRILERMAIGETAEVYKARLGAEPVVCLKRIRPDVLDRPELVEAFEQEMSLARRLRHPNIIEVYDQGEDAEGHYFVMELIDGCDLETLLWTSGPLSPALVAYLGIEAASALVYIHHTDRVTGRTPVAHCDVSPHNLLIRRDGVVKLSDFGVAKVLPKTGAEELTRKRGRERYASPEQWLGEPLGTRTDLFSLGLVLWKALVGTHPYAESRPPGGGMLNAWIQKNTIGNERRSVAEAAPHAPTALNEAIEGLLAPVETRTATAEDLLDALSPLATLHGAAELAAHVATVNLGGPE